MLEFDLDLTADPVPPKELNIEVRVLEDCGHIFTGGVNRQPFKAVCSP